MEYLIAFIIAIAVAELTRVRPTSNIKAKGLDQLVFPTVSADRSIMVAVGDVFLEAPNVIWYGDYKKKRLTTTVRDGLFNKKALTAGYQYSVGMELALCWGSIDALTEIWFGDKQAWTGNVSEGLLHVKALNIFGGEKNGGGVRATCCLYPGNDNQDFDPYMSSMVGEEYHHKGLAKLVWYGPSYDEDSGLLTESGQVESIKLRVNVLPKYLDSGFHDINGQANPAEVLYMLMTGKYVPVVGEPVVSSINDSHIDIPHLKGVAETLYNEGKGISFQWQTGTPPDDIISDILRHIDAVRIESPTTGLVQIILSRKDYNKEDLLVLNESNSTVTQFARNAVTSTVNEVVADYTDPLSGFKQVPMSVMDVGNMFAQSNHVPTELDLTMFHDPAVVNERASAHLHQLSSTLARGNLEADRSAWSLYEGGLFVLDQESMGESGLVCRVLKIKRGGFEDRKISIEFVEDVFALGTAIYSGAPSSAWQEVISSPEAVMNVRIEEAPYTLLDDDGAHQILALAARPNPSSFEMGVLTSLDDSYYVRTNDSSDFAQYGELVSVLPLNTLAVYAGDLIVSGRFSGLIDATDEALRVNFANWFLINDEWVAVGSVVANEDGTTTLSDIHRGMIDTVPGEHGVGDPVWQLTGADIVDRVFDTGSSPYLKLLPVTPKGELTSEASPAISYLLVNRALKPLPPGNIKVNDNYLVMEVGGDLIISWADRNRLDKLIINQDYDASEPDPDVIYSIRIYDEVNSLIFSSSNIETPFLYSLLQEQTDTDGQFQSQLTIEVFSVSSEGESYQRQKRIIPKTVRSENEWDVDLNEVISDSDQWVVDLSTMNGFTTSAKLAYYINPIGVGGVNNETFAHYMTATGGARPLAWSIVSGALPAGWTLNSDGLISGLADDVAGYYPVVIQCVDNDGNILTEDIDVALGDVVSMLHFEGVNNGTDIIDQSGKLWTASGDARISTSDPISASSSLVLDGSGDYITTPHSSDFTVTSDFTLNVQVRPSAIGSLKYIVTKRPLGVSSSFSIWIGADGKLGAGAWNDGDLAFVFLADNAFVAGSIYHVRLEKKGVRWWLYVDGEVVDSADQALAPSDSAGSLYIGREPNNASRDFAGSIDEFEFIRGAALSGGLSFEIPVAPSDYPST